MMAATLSLVDEAGDIVHLAFRMGLERFPQTRRPSNRPDGRSAPRSDSIRRRCRRTAARADGERAYNDVLAVIKCVLGLRSDLGLITHPDLRDPSGGNARQLAEHGDLGKPTDTLAIAQWLLQ